MSLSINNNITALNAWRNLKSTDMRMSSTMEKLSSGMRINRAADDPAGLVISEKMRAQLAGLDAAVKNSEKAINMIQTAEAALDQVAQLMDKMRQLALDSANSGVNDAASLQANQDELDEAIASVTRIANYTQFGTKKLLDGTLGNNFSASGTEVTSASFGGVDGAEKTGSVSAQVTTAGEQATVEITFTAAQALGTADKAFQFDLNGVTIDIAVGEDIDAKINGYQTQTGVSASLGAAFSAVTLTSVGYGATEQVSYVAGAAGTSISGAASSAADFGVDAAATVSYADGTTATYTVGHGLTIADATGNSMVLSAAFGGATGANTAVGTLTVNEANFQVGANENQSVAMSIQSTRATQLGIGASYTNNSGTVTSVTTFTSLDHLKSGGAYTNGVFVDGGADAIAQAIGVIDEAIDEISTVRGSLGAKQADNLQVQLDSLRITYENLQAAESTIRDTDMTLEMANFTKYQIMMQAGTAMLAQANQAPNNILQLLR